MLKIGKVRLIIVMLLMISGMGMIFYNNLPEMYSYWLQNTPSVSKKVKKSTVHKTTTTMSPPTTLNDQLKSLTNDQTLGLSYKGKLISPESSIATPIYQDQTTRDGISDYLLNAGVSGLYKNDNHKFGTSNDVIAGHTYIGAGSKTKALTPLQYQTKIGDMFYFTDSKDVYSFKVYDISKIKSVGGVYILDSNRWKDKEVNPSGKPMLTLYDCTEPEDPAKFISNPPYRNVVLASLENVTDYENSDMKKDFGDIPQVNEEHEVSYDDNEHTFKDTSRKGNFKLIMYDILFKDIRIQDIVKKFI